MFGNILQLAMQDTAQLIQGVRTNIHIFPQAIQLSLTELIFFDQFILGYSLFFHCIPQTVIYDHEKHLFFLSYMIANLLTIAHNWAIIYSEVIAMAEFCLECWNKMNHRNDSSWRYVLSWELDICEGCGEWKRVIVCEREWLLRLFPFLR